MTDLALSLHELPPSAVSAILDVLQTVYEPGVPALAVLIFDREGVVSMGEITVSDTETQLVAKVTALDSEGHETTFDAAPTWESSDDSVATCRPDADGYTCAFDIGAPGSAAITCTGIEDSSGEDVSIISSGLINVTAGDAVVGSIDFAITAPETP